MEFVGSNGSNHLFVQDDKGVIVDGSRNLIVDIGSKDALVASMRWETVGNIRPTIAEELAVASITSLDINVVSTNERLYTIPNSVSSEAKRGLTWKSSKGGGTPVGISTAALLASGGQINIKKIRHIAKYFPRHEDDKYKDGFSSSEESYPSNGRISWALWGGDAARSWATTIINKENKINQKNAITASFDYIMSGYDAPDRAQLTPFEEAETLSEDFGPQFYVRIRVDGSGIDRLYMVDPEGLCFVWDDSMWEDLGNVHHDFDTYDRSLDDPSDTTEKLYVPVDTETAVIVSAYLSSSPFESIPIESISQEEAQLFVDAADEMNWSEIDSLFKNPAILAAGEPGLVKPSTPTSTAKHDGNYTPEERSKNASSQVRDKVGQFAKQGGTVVVGGNPAYKGTITSINPDNQTVKLRMANGKFVDVPANLTEDADKFTPLPAAPAPSAKNITNGILGDPRTPIDSSVAKLPGLLPQLTSNQTSSIMKDWSLWAADQREAAKAPSTPGKPSTKPLQGKYKTPNAYNDPLLRDFLNKKVNNADGTSSYPNASWYRPDLNKGYDAGKMQGYAKSTSSSATNPKWMGQKPSGYAVPKGIKASAGTPLTPDTSDVAPIYMAIVAADDPQAVMDLVAMIPASSESTEPVTFKRTPGKWVPAPMILNDLRSPTPPPVVVLDDETLKTVITQVDAPAVRTASGYQSLISAGGLDRNRGNAEKLRRYWLYGKGAAKIRWNTPGDWTRCVRHLSKFMGPRAKGYCALRHKEATGMWTGDREHEQLDGHIGGRKTFSTDVLAPEVAIIATAELKMKAEQARARVNGVSPSMSEGQHGSEFIIPLLIPEETESGDGRSFVKGAITSRELPLPLLWQIKTAEGHAGSVVVGKIVSLERIANGLGNARGYFDTGVAGKEAERLVRGGFIRGVSADMDMFEADESEPENAENAPDTKIGGGKMEITKARVMAATIVPKPAFQECFIKLVGDTPTEQEEPDVITDGVYVDGVNAADASALIACGMIAGAIPVTPPKEWFSNPKLDKPSALTVTDDGRVFGHIAAWHVDHIGMAFGTKPPRSKSQYAYFHTGVIRTDDGSDIPVGQLTLAGGHASLEASASEAVRHYDDTASAVADVHAGEDAFGIWVSGALRPGTTPEQIRALRASAPSGDWRPIRGGLELVAVLQVNTPGFPIARARVASGQVMALVAAGASVLAQLKSDPISDITQRLNNLEAPIVAAANDAKTRVAAMTASIRAAELAARVKDARDKDSFYMLQTITDDDSDLAVISRQTRLKLADQGKALPNGSFPIRNASDLRNAVHAYGRSRPGQRGEVRRHIMKMARLLDKTDLIPADWKKSGLSSDEQDALISAGGLDRNRGNAEKLRRYWVHGEGAAKIRWGQGGDWARCVRYLSKHMGIRAKGYCQLRHKEALGIYTSTHAEKLKKHTNFEVMIDAADFTQVTDFDMNRPIEDIHADYDESFDPSFEPHPEIIEILQNPDIEDGEQKEDQEDPNCAPGGFEFAIEDENPLYQDNQEPQKVPDLTEEDKVGLSPEEIKILEKEIKDKRHAIDQRAKYTPDTQPRDTSGRFRQVLARLKVDLGDVGSQVAVEKIKETEKLDDAGNYGQAVKSAADLLDIIDRLDTGALDATSVDNVRSSARELGKVIANLPFAFGQDAQKIRFSDVPPVLKNLMEDMIDRVNLKIGPKDGAIATHDLKNFMSGGDYYSQSEISSQMAKLLRLLT